MSDNIRGAMWILASCVATTIMAVGIRELTPEFHSAQIAFVRCFVGLLIIFPGALHLRHEEIGSRRLRLHLARGVLAVIGINMGYYAISALPLVTVTALFFTAPLFVTILAVIVLGEKVGLARWVATCVGFLGALVVIGFHPQRFEPIMFLAVGSSFTFAAALIVGKKLSTTERPITILFFFSVITTIGCLPPAILVWQAPSFAAWTLLGVVAVFATSRSYFDIRGYAAAHASFVAPWFYFRIIFMGVTGYWLFREVPGVSALVGAAIIVVATLYISFAERKGGNQGTAIGP